jgi:hypothetical membrane protein
VELTLQDNDRKIRWVRWSSIGGIVGTAAFFLFILVIGAARDGYNALSDEISQLGAAGAPGAWMQSTNFILFGLLLIALAWGLHKGIEGNGSRLGPILIGTFGLLAAVGNGVFPTDQYGAPETTVGNLHSSGAGLGFTALIVAMFMLPRRLRQDDEWTDLADLSRWMGLASTVLMLLYLVVSETEGCSDDYVVLIQRIFAATVLAWLLILSFRLFRVSRARAEALAASPRP